MAIHQCSEDFDILGLSTVRILMPKTYTNFFEFSYRVVHQKQKVLDLHPETGNQVIACK